MMEIVQSARGCKLSDSYVAARSSGIQKSGGLRWEAQTRVAQDDVRRAIYGNADSHLWVYAARARAKYSC